jgi:hypothetical protein
MIRLIVTLCIGTLFLLTACSGGNIVVPDDPINAHWMLGTSYSSNMFPESGTMMTTKSAEGCIINLDASFMQVLGKSDFTMILTDTDLGGLERGYESTDVFYRGPNEHHYVAFLARFTGESSELRIEIPDPDSDNKVLGTLYFASVVE